MSIAGELVVTLAFDGTRVRDVAIRSTRPTIAARVLAGRTADEACATVPRLYGVCAHAQGAAAAEAVAAALGAPVRTARAWRELGVALEALQEDLWRALVDVPLLLGVRADVDGLATARRACAPLMERLAPASRSTRAEGVAVDDAAVSRTIATLHDVVAARVLDEAPSAFLARNDEPSLRTWALRATTAPALASRALFAGDPGAGAGEGAALARLDRATVESSVLPALASDAAFARMPHVRGEPRETGALDRAHDQPAIAALTARHGRGVATRWFARLVQLASAAEALRSRAVAATIDGWPPEPDQGVAVVRTARGLLLHRARIERGRVAAYDIVAPTEWNFHPRGALARGLRELRAPDAAELARKARLVVQLADACVPCRVEVADA